MRFPRNSHYKWLAECEKRVSPRTSVKKPLISAQNSIESAEKGPENSVYAKLMVLLDGRTTRGPGLNSIRLRPLALAK